MPHRLSLFLALILTVGPVQAESNAPGSVSTEVTTAVTEPAAATSVEPGVEKSPGTVLDQLKALGLDRDTFKALLADSSGSESTLAGAATTETLLEWYRLLEARKEQDNRTRQVSVLRAERDRVDLQPAASEPASEGETGPRDAAWQTRLTDQLELLERDGKVLSSLLLEREATIQSVRSLPPPERTKSIADTSRTTTGRVRDLLEDRRTLLRAQLEVIDGRIATERQLTAVRQALVQELKERSDDAASSRTVSADQVEAQQKRVEESAKHLQKEQAEARQAILKAEGERLAAEKRKEEAQERGRSAQSNEERSLAEEESRLAALSAASAEASKQLAQVRSAGVVANHFRTEQELLLYRTLHLQELGQLNLDSCRTLLQDIRSRMVELESRKKGLDARLLWLEVARQDLVDARASLEELEAPSDRQQSRLRSAQSRAIQERSGLLDEIGVGLSDRKKTLEVTREALSRLAQRLEAVLHQEDLFSKRAAPVRFGSLKRAVADLSSLLANPSRLKEPMQVWFQAISASIEGDEEHRLLTAFIGTVLVSFGLLLFGSPVLRGLAHQTRERIGKATSTSLAMAHVALCWVPVLVPFLFGVKLLPELATGFTLFLVWLIPWCIIHLAARMAADWILPLQISGSPESNRRGEEMWLTRWLLPIPPGEWDDLEAEQCRSLRRTLWPMALLSGTLLPAWLGLKQVLYDPEITRLLWLLYELIMMVLIYRLVSARATLTRLRTEAGITTGTGSLLMVSVRLMTLVFLPAIPLLEAFGYAGMGRFLLTRVGLTVLLTNLVRLLLHAALECWESAREEDRDDLPDTEYGEAPILEDSLADLLARMFSLVVGLFTIIAVFTIWGGTREGWETLTASAAIGMEVLGFQVSALAVLQAALVIWIATWCSRVVNLVLEQRVYPRTKLDAGVRYTLKQTLHYCILGLGLVLSLEALGAGLDGLKWFAGFAGIGIGFGMQNIVQNFISGLILLYERPVRVGDVVEVSGIFGTVQRITVRSTIVRQRSNVDVIVPNSTMISENVVNWTLDTQKSRIEVKMGVAYGCDVQHVKRIFLEAAKEHKMVLRRPEPNVLFVEFGDSSLNFTLMVWVVEPIRIRDIQSDLLFMCHRKLGEAGIQIPFPQRDLHVRSSIPVRIEMAPPEAGQD